MKKTSLTCFVICCILLYAGSAWALLIEGSWNSNDDPGIIDTGTWVSEIHGTHPGWVNSTLDAVSDISSQWSIDNLVRTGGTIVNDGTASYGSYANAYFQEVIHTNDSGTATFQFNGDDYTIAGLQGESTTTFYFFSEAAYLLYGTGALVGVEDMMFTQSALFTENDTLFEVEFTVTGYRTWENYSGTVPVHGGVADYVQLSIEAVPSPVPEPGTMILFGAGLIAIAGVRRMRSKSASGA
ncbi:MAG: PEP-CTERM sorting domain-containing protein [Deltaproteobacteria bacterium]|nr:PEP-CTERM sorting domain-containing protein [Deltaproteobacteria bacterium]